MTVGTVAEKRLHITGQRSVDNGLSNLFISWIPALLPTGGSRPAGPAPAEPANPRAASNDDGTDEHGPDLVQCAAEQWDHLHKRQDRGGRLSGSAPQQAPQGGL